MSPETSRRGLKIKDETHDEMFSFTDGTHMLFVVLCEYIPNKGRTQSDVAQLRVTRQLVWGEKRMVGVHWTRRQDVIRLSFLRRYETYERFLSDGTERQQERNVSQRKKEAGSQTFA
jgi:hypothetical protein